MATTFADDIFRYISLNEYFWILNEISMKYVTQGLILHSCLFDTGVGICVYT